MLDIITIGDATLDTFIILDNTSTSCHILKHKKMLCLNYAQKTPIEHSVQSVGGNAANVAVGAKKLGHKTAIVTELGDDFSGHIIAEELERDGVDTAFIKKLKKKTTRYSIVLNFETERTILSYYAPRKYTLPHLPQSSWIYYSSLGKNFESLQNKLTQHLDRHPTVKLAFNPGSYQVKHGLKKIQELLPRVDLLFVNKEEAALLLESKAKNIPTMLKSLCKLGIKIVAITDSTNGSYAYDGTNMYKMGVYPIEPKARTGAGDAYASGFLSAIAYGKSLPEAMQWGSANAAGVIQEFGAQKGLCTKNKLKKIVAKFPKHVPTLTK